MPVGTTPNLQRKPLCGACLYSKKHPCDACQSDMIRSRHMIINGGIHNSSLAYHPVLLCYSHNILYLAFVPGTFSHGRASESQSIRPHTAGDKVRRYPGWAGLGCTALLYYTKTIQYTVHTPYTHHTTPTLATQHASSQYVTVYLFSGGRRGCICSCSCRCRCQKPVLLSHPIPSHPVTSIHRRALVSIGKQ